MSLTKQWNDIEGQVRYFLRCYSQDEEENGRVRKKRYLSLIPGQGEYGICRGADEDNWPRECELSWKVFASIIGLDNETVPVPAEQETVPAAQEQSKPVEKPKPRVRSVKKPAEPVPTPLVVEAEPDEGETDEEETKPVQVEEPEIEGKRAEPVEQPIDTSTLTPEERRKIVLERIAAMKKK
jgi:hypothetical protein